MDGTGYGSNRKGFHRAIFTGFLASHEVQSVSRLSDVPKIMDAEIPAIELRPCQRHSIVALEALRNSDIQEKHRFFLQILDMYVQPDWGLMI